MSDNWLGSGSGDINNDNVVDFVDFALLALGW
jgi:hypothetical protein